MALPVIVRNALLDALALVMPVECAGCEAPDRALCAACTGALTPVTEHHRLHDGTPVVSALRYGGVVRRVILACKEHGRTDVAAPLAKALGAAISAAAISAASLATAERLELVTVPPSRAARRRRGYDPVALLVRRAGYRAAPGLRVTRSTAAQKSLSVEGRRANRLGSLRATRSFEGCAVLLVDDVLTTGATLAEAARAIREAGGVVTACAVVAFTPRHSRGTAGRA